jgi:23S rRNA pseudouridine2457 synthase
MKNHHHYIIHKPFGYLSQFVNNQNKRKNKKLLGELYVLPEGIMAIGRLDENSEGLLLLTTDGQISEDVRSQQIEKEYNVEVDGVITQEVVQQLIAGVEISIFGKKYITLPCKASLLTSGPDYEAGNKKIRHERHGPTSWVSITITEGKFRQVRKMTAVMGFPTLRLIRIRIGSIHLDQLQAGEIMEVDNFNL